MIPTARAVLLAHTSPTNVVTNYLVRRMFVCVILVRRKGRGPPRCLKLPRPGRGAAGGAPGGAGAAAGRAAGAKAAQCSVP